MFEDASQPTVVSTVGFNVPCRRFVITASVTSDRRMPVVDEFVLRTLKLCEKLPTKRLGRYLGFSYSEAETVILDLLGRGLIEVRDDMVELHPAGKEAFQGSKDGLPRLMQIDTWVERLWFDLVSQNMMKPERTRPLPNLVDVVPLNLERDILPDFARRAFEANFADYVRTVRKIQNPERLSLYAINDTNADRFGSVVIVGREDLVLEPRPEIRTHFIELTLDKSLQYRPLVTAMRDAHRRLMYPAISAASIHDYVRLTKDDSIVEAQRADRTIDLRSWLALQQGRDTDVQKLVGDPYLPRNVTVFCKAVERVGAARLRGNKGSHELIWFRPLGSAWGRSPDLQSSLSQITGVVRGMGRQGASMVRALVVAPARGADREKGFMRIFDSCHRAPSGTLGGGVEVVLLRGVAAMVFVRVSVGGQAEIAVGHTVTDETQLARIEELLRLTTILRRENRLWKKSGAIDDSVEGGVSDIVDQAASNPNELP